MQMLRRFVLLAAAVSVWAPLSIAQQREVEVVNGRNAAAREVLVKFRASAMNPLQRLIRDEDVDETQGVGNAGLVRIRSRSRNAATLLQNLSRNPDVELAEPNYILYATADPSDAYFNLLWGLKNTGQNIGGQSGTPGADIDATSAWNISTGSTANVVGVVDTGVDYNHPDLAPNVWSAPSSFTVTIGGVQITCAAGTHGFNAIKGTCNPLDDNDHGTHVSGTIGAVGSNVRGGGGELDGIHSRPEVPRRKGSGFTSDAINAIEFAIQMKSQGIANVRVLNNSWGGGGFSQSLLDEINKANASDMLFVAAAGNDGRDNDSTAFYPANYDAPNVVSVAATDNRDALASFSNYGVTTVDLGAPGVYIASTVRSGGYAYMSGTSMATPHVSGAAALVLSKCALDTGRLKSALLTTVDQVSSLSGRTGTDGRLNVYSAINSCAAAPTPDFSLSASPASVSATAGNSTASTITVGSLNSFGGTVSLSASGLPSGASAAFSPSFGQWKRRLHADDRHDLADAGGYLPRHRYRHIRRCGARHDDHADGHGARGALVYAERVTRIEVDQAGTDGQLQGDGDGLGWIRRPVSLTVSGQPTGSSAAFSPTTVLNGSGMSTLTVVTDKSTATGTYNLVITGTSSDLPSKTVTASLKIR